MTSCFDISSLYPVVHDLTEAEYDENSAWCSAEQMLVGCFSIKDLVRPVEEPRPASAMRSMNTAPVDKTCCARQRAVSVDDSLVLPDSSSSDGILAAQKSQNFHDLYVLTRQINRGRFSTVWEAIDRESGTRYAAKIFDRRMLSPKEDAAAKREAAMLKQLGDYPTGTVSVHDVIEEPSHIYIMMDFVEGATLLTRVLDKGPLTEPEARKVAKSLLQGLRYLHHQDICHRNLKPDNILVSYEGAQVTIVDFGLSAVMPYSNGERGMLTGRCGSATYAAPEVQQSLPYDTQSDIWTVGVALYFCITGYPPFVDKTKRGLLRKVTRGEFSFSSKHHWSGRSRGARRFISSLLKVDPKLRPTADEALNDPWLAPSGPLPPIKEEPKKKHKKTPSKLGRMLKKLRGSSQERKSIPDDDSSYSSHTMSLASTEVGGDSVGRLSPRRDDKL